jgi:perosamine synthetase
VEKLAIHGGLRVREQPMPPRKAFGPDEIALIMDLIQYYRDLPIDPPYNGKYEQEFCREYVAHMGGMGFADAVSTGTGSVFVALEALELPKGSEVILPGVVDAGPLNCIIYQGLKPVIADTKLDSYNMGVKEFLDKVTKNTSAIIAVHCGGEPLEIDSIVREAKSLGIKVLEDCSQAPGARYKGDRIGTFGDISATSTMYRKSLTTGGSGGLIFSKNLNLHHKGLTYADRGKAIWNKNYDIRDPGSHLYPALNWNANELSCAIGIASLRRLDETIKNRKEYCESVARKLKENSNVCRAYEFNYEYSPFFLPIIVNEKRITCSKNDFALAVQAEGIDLNPDYKFLIQDWQWAKPYISSGVDTPNALKMRNTSFNLFVNENYGPKEVEDTIKAIYKVSRFYEKV